MGKWVVFAGVLAAVFTGAGDGRARAATAASCPSRGEVIDSLRGGAGMSSLWLIMSFGSLVGLSAVYGGPVAGVAVSLAGGGLSAVSGLQAVDRLDSVVRAALPEMAARLHRNPEDLYDQVVYGEQIISGNWLLRVAGATVGSIVGVLTPLGLWPMSGVRGSVMIGSAGGVALGGLWHRWALWPFVNDLPELCRSAAPTTRI